MPLIRMVHNLEDVINRTDPLAADVAAQWKENEANAIATGNFHYWTGWLTE